MSWYKRLYEDKRLLAALLALGVLILLGFVIFDNDEDERRVLRPREGEVEILGIISCMPTRTASVPTGESCVKGIAGEDGKFYALDTLDIHRPEDSLPVGSHVEAVGKFIPAATSSSESEIFLYDGVLVARILQRAEADE